jgi:hypothetical protein
LEDAIRIPKEIEEKNAGNPMPVDDLATAVGFRLANDWRFLDLLRSADQYGLVERTGGSVSLTKLGQDVVAPSSPSQRSEALLTAFRNVKDFAAVEKFYGGKRIPEDEFFLNTLTREFNIPRDRVDTFAKIFVDNLKFLRAFTPSSISETQALPDEALPGTTPPDKIPTSAAPREPRIREFLDTCFVMMPFGAWFDRYYQDIYAPAIKEAGFEPMLFRRRGGRRAQLSTRWTGNLHLLSDRLFEARPLGPSITFRRAPLIFRPLPRCSAGRERFGSSYN